MAAGEFSEIQPEHFCMAVLKFAEVAAKMPGEAGREADLALAIAGDAELVREALGKCGIESKAARRKLRRQLGKGDSPFDGGKVHRSSASRKLFESAAALAAESGSETLTPLHLLTALVQAPTPAIVQAVLDGKVPGPPPPALLPLLEKHGRDLVKEAAEGAIQVKTGFEAQSKAVIQSLQQKDRKSVLLVCDSDDLVADLSTALAVAIAAKVAPEELKGRRLIDISTNNTAKLPKKVRPFPWDEADLDLMRQMLAEAAVHPEVILLVPAVEAEPKESGEGAWTRLLTETLLKGAVQFICRVTPAVFAEHVRKDPVWKRRTHAIWLEQAAQGSVPREL